MISLLANLTQQIDQDPVPVEASTWPGRRWRRCSPSSAARCCCSPSTALGTRKPLRVGLRAVHRGHRRRGHRVRGAAVGPRAGSGRGAFSTLSQAVGVDGFSLFATVTIAAAVILGALLLDGWLRREGMEGAEPYVLLMLSASGGVMMASANDLIVMFLGLEILSIAVYVLAAMHLRKITSQEAGVKYFVLGAFSSAFFLYGIALTYGGTGSTNLVEISGFLSTTVLTDTGLVLAGLALLLVGFAFKVAAVPFHFWTPDVYQGAPSPSVSWMASGVKVAGFAGLLRVFYLAFGTYRRRLAADRVRRRRPHPGRRLRARGRADRREAHARLLLDQPRRLRARRRAGRQRAGRRRRPSSTWPRTRSWWRAASASSRWCRKGDIGNCLDDYRGLSRDRPLLALAFALFLFAQAGVPLTSGFFAKFYVITAAVDAGSTWLASSPCSPRSWPRSSTCGSPSPCTCPRRTPASPGPSASPSPPPGPGHLAWSPSASACSPLPRQHRQGRHPRPRPGGRGRGPPLTRLLPRPRRPSRRRARRGRRTARRRVAGGVLKVVLTPAGVRRVPRPSLRTCAARCGPLDRCSLPRGRPPAAPPPGSPLHADSSTTRPDVELVEPLARRPLRLRRGPAPSRQPHAGPRLQAHRRPASHG